MDMKILVDIHEKNSLVASELISLGIDVNFQHLKVADYMIGNVAIERKTVGDFINSMINRRLLRQLEELKQYEKRLLVIEGIEEQELYNDDSKGEGMHGNSIRGMLIYIVLEANCPIIFTKDYRDTAKFMQVIVKRIEKSPAPISLHAKKKSLNQEEQKQSILESFPGIGPKTAKRLLEELKSIKKIINASDEELQKILKSKTEYFKRLLE